MAKLVGDQLSRFATLNPHQLAGQAANLDFWLSQVRHALDVLDGYGVRFVRMEAAQEHHVDTHPSSGAVPPRRVPDRELRKARRELTEHAYRFLARCLKEGLIPEPQLQAACTSLGLTVDGRAIDG